MTPQLCRPCRENPRPNLHCSCRRTIDIRCGSCGQEFWVTGETAQKRADALAAWPGCGCEVAS